MTPENSTYESESHKIYVSMVRMYPNAESTRICFGDSSQPNNWILDSGATCHMKPEISDFIPDLLVETEKYIEVEDGHLITGRQTGEVQIKFCGDNGKPFVATLYKVLLAPDL